MAAADQALLDQIQRLSGALRRAQDHGPTAKLPQSTHHHNPNTYQYSRGRGRYQYPKYAPVRPPPPPAPKNVEIGGELFKASTNKLTRQTNSGALTLGYCLRDSSAVNLTNPSNMSSDPPSSSSSSTPAPARGKPRPQRARGGRFPMQQSGVRVYKPRASGRRHHANMSLVLNKVNNASPKKAKLDKQCPFFSRTGMCTRGKSCRYQHDPEKVAICPRYLAGDCSSTAETCLLSHSSTLNRVPPCVHFQNNGRCKNGDQCLYPHVRMGVKSSVCRDFAVLGYCEKGIDCDEAHIRECPDFAETGACKNPKCKLPHVIRANRKNLNITTKQTAPPRDTETTAPRAVTPTKDAPTADQNTDPPQLPINGVNYTFEGGDEYIPLTFVESEEDEADGEETSEEEDEEEEDEDAEEQEVTEVKVFA